jgi:hypothetical protein
LDHNNGLYANTENPPQAIAPSVLTNVVATPLWGVCIGWKPGVLVGTQRRNYSVWHLRDGFYEEGVPRFIRRVSLSPFSRFFLAFFAFVLFSLWRWRGKLGVPLGVGVGLPTPLTSGCG